jgi:hypothetical protein
MRSRPTGPGEGPARSTTCGTAERQRLAEGHTWRHDVLERAALGPGNTDLSTPWRTGMERMSPARGPRSVLCVVLVTIGACGTGDGYTPPATSPAKCAMSTRKMAPTSSAIERNASKSMIRA